MFFVYILQSKKDNKYYVGYTSDLEKRLKWHNEGKNASTKHRTPLVLIHFEKFLNKKGAIQREKEIKSYKGGNAFRKLVNGRVA